MRDSNFLLLLAVAVLGLVLLSRRSPVQQTSNAETWEWVDWQGNTRRAVVHRDVRSS